MSALHNVLSALSAASAATWAWVGFGTVTIGLYAIGAPIPELLNHVITTVPLEPEPEQLNPIITTVPLEPEPEQLLVSKSHDESSDRRSALIDALMKSNNELSEIVGDGKISLSEARSILNILAQPSEGSYESDDEAGKDKIIHLTPNEPLLVPEINEAHESINKGNKSQSYSLCNDGTIEVNGKKFTSSAAAFADAHYNSNERNRYMTYGQLTQLPLTEQQIAVAKITNRIPNEELTLSETQMAFARKLLLEDEKLTSSETQRAFARKLLFEDDLSRKLLFEDARARKLLFGEDLAEQAPDKESRVENIAEPLPKTDPGKAWLQAFEELTSSEERKRLEKAKDETRSQMVEIERICKDGDENEDEARLILNKR